MKSLKELLDAQKALEIEIAERMSQIPAEREIRAIIANIAEKHGFKIDVTLGGMTTQLTPDDYSVAVCLYHDYVCEVSSADKIIRTFEVESRITGSRMFKNVDEMLKAAEEITQAANLVKELQSRDYLYRSEYDAPSSGIILNSGDENLIAKYIEVLNLDINLFEKRLSQEQKQISQCQSEINELASSNKKRDKERITNLQSEITRSEDAIKDYQNCIEIRQKELAKIDNRHEESKAA